MFARVFKRVAAPGCGLQICPTCRGDFIYVEERHRERGECWRLQLRCGQCSSSREVWLSTDLAQRLEADVAAGVDAIADEVAMNDMKHMSRLADSLAIALERDLIDAADFGHSYGTAADLSRRSRRPPRA
jgi:hypothetical protein